MNARPRNTVLSLILVLGLALPRYAIPCSSFAFAHKGFPVFGTNCHNRLKSYKNPRVQFVDLMKIDFSCGRPAAMLDAHADLASDITGAFHDYSHDEAEAHIVKALAYFRPNLPLDMVRQVLALFESFACEPAKK